MLPIKPKWWVCYDEVEACILKTISSVVLYYPQIAGYKTSKKRIAVFEKPKFTFLVEKRLAGERVPFPLVIEHVLNKDVLTISKEIANAKDTDIAEGENVIGKKAKLQDKLYPKLPRFIRLIIWKVMLSNFRFSYKTMGNISVSSVGIILGRFCAADDSISTSNPI
jgi:hypothetical protein